MSAAVAPLVTGGWLVLPAGEVHVWRAELDVAPRRLAELAATLSREERARAMRLRRPRDRDRWVAARGTLRGVLAAYAGGEPGALVFGAGPHGKPYLVDHFTARLAGGTASARTAVDHFAAEPAPLRFSLAHADAVALIAVAWRRELGVDVECERPDRADLDVARRLFSPEEAAALAALPADARARAFFAVWATREAYAKAVGLGLDAMATTPPPDWTVRHLAVGPGYAGALAVEHGAEAVLCRRWPEA